MSAAHLQIQFHGENPQALPSKEKAKVADFYAARDRTTPPLPWPSIAPPFSDKLAAQRHAAEVGRRVLGELKRLERRIVDAGLMPDD